MLTSALDAVEFPCEYPELIGKRVLITGASGALGVEIARAFADSRARVILQTPGDAAEAQALAEIVACSALDVRLFGGPLDDADAKLRFVRDAVQCFGGLDCVINIAHVTGPVGNTDAAVESAVTELLSLPVITTKVAANRMRMMRTEGLILNLVAEERGAGRDVRLVAAIARSSLASLTRNEAQTWSTDGIRINAIVPADPRLSGASCITGAPDIATLILHLASERGHQLSGLVFEAYCG